MAWAALCSRLVKLADEWFYAPRWTALERVLSERAAGRDDFFFVQIGANDGDMRDHLRGFILRHGWRGVLVEPVPAYCARLRANYEGHPGLAIEEIAISSREERRELFRIRDDVPHLPAWCRGLASFHLDVVLKHRFVVPDLAEYIVREEVQCLPLNRLLEKHRVERLDLLSIDTEGHDYEIIKQIDFAILRPGIVLYEHRHLKRPDRADCESLLRSQGYRLTSRLGNTLAY
jgi:FkbM family methyltransferase